MSVTFELHELPTAGIFLQLSSDWGSILEQELKRIRFILLAILATLVAGFTGILETATSALTSYFTVTTPEQVLRSTVSVVIVLVATVFWGLLFAAVFQRIKAASGSHQGAPSRLRAATLDLGRVALALGTVAMWVLSIVIGNAAASFVLSAVFE